MNVKQYLKQIYIANQRIKQLEETRDTVTAELHSVKSPNYKYDRVQSSVTGNSVERLIVKADGLTKDIESELDYYFTIKQQIIQQIRDMPEQTDAQSLQKDCLYNRYVLFHKWEHIADEMGISLRYVYMIHGHALQAFQKIYYDSLH